MSQSTKNILISMSVGVIIFLILAIGYNLKIIPISINISNTIQSVQKQVDQLGIDFLGQIQLERAKMKELAENNFVVDSFANQIITDKVYSEVYEYTIRTKNCYGVTFVNNDKSIFFVYPPYASKRKGMVIASEYFNHFLTKEYSILPFQTSKEAQSTDEIVLGYPVQKEGKILGLALFHYSGTSLLTEPIKKSPLSIKGFAFVKAYNMIVFNVTKEIMEDKDKFSDILLTIDQENKTIGPIKVGSSKYYFFSSQIGKAGKQVVVMPADKVGTPLVVQVVISFYLITIIMLITYVLLAFFFNPKEEEIDLKGHKYYQKPHEYEELKNKEEEEEFLSAVSSEEKKKDFFFEEVKSEKPIDKAFKSLVEEVSTKKSPLEVSLEEQYVFTPPSDEVEEKLPEIDLKEKFEEKIEEKEEIELPQLTEEIPTEITEEKEELGIPEIAEEVPAEMIEEKEGLELPEISEEIPTEITEEKEGLELPEIGEEPFIEEKKEEEFEIPQIGEEIPSKITEEKEGLELPEIGEEPFIEEKKEEEFEIPSLEEVTASENIEEETISEKVEEKEFELPKVETLEKNVEMTEFEIEPKEEEIQLPDIEQEVIEEKEFEKKESELPTLEELEESKEEYKDFEIKEKEEFELPEEVINISEEMKSLGEMELPEIEEKVTETVVEIAENPQSQSEFESEPEEEIPPLEDFSVYEEEKPSKVNESKPEDENIFTELPDLEEQNIEGVEESNIEDIKGPEESFEQSQESTLESIIPQENIEELPSIEKNNEGEEGFIQEPEDIEILETPTEIENEVLPQETEEFEIPPIEDLEKEIPSEDSTISLEDLNKSPEEFLDIQPIGSIAEELETGDNTKTEEVVEKGVEENIREDESEFFENISSDEIALSAEELDNVAKHVEEEETSPELSTELSEELPEVDTNILPEENIQEDSSFDDLAIPKIEEEDFNNITTTETPTKAKELPYDNLCSSFASEYKVDAIAFFKSEGSVFTCGGASDPGFSFIQFEADEPIIEKLSNLRKDIYIPEGINKFQPLLQKNEELFSNMNSMYVHGIFDEGQLLGVIFIFNAAGNEKEKEEFYHIATKLSELITT